MPGSVLNAYSKHGAKLDMNNMCSKPVASSGKMQMDNYGVSFKSYSTEAEVGENRYVYCLAMGIYTR